MTSENAEADAYKVPEMKTLEELKKLDAEDESLRKYKESLLGNASDNIRCLFSFFT